MRSWFKVVATCLGIFSVASFPATSFAAAPNANVAQAIQQVEAPQTPLTVTLSGFLNQSQTSQIVFPDQTRITNLLASPNLTQAQRNILLEMPTYAVVSASVFGKSSGDPMATATYEGYSALNIPLWQITVWQYYYENGSEVTSVDPMTYLPQVWGPGWTFSWGGDQLSSPIPYPTVSSYTSSTFMLIAPIIGLPVETVQVAMNFTLPGNGDWSEKTRVTSS